MATKIVHNANNLGTPLRYVAPPEPLEVSRQKAEALRDQLSRSSVKLGGNGPAEYFHSGWQEKPSSIALDQNRAQRELAHNLKQGSRMTTHDFGDGLEPVPLEKNLSNRFPVPISGVEYRGKPTLTALNSQIKLGDNSLGMPGRSVMQEEQQPPSSAIGPEHFQASHNAYLANKFRNGLSKITLGNGAPMPLESGSLPNLMMQHPPPRRHLLQPLSEDGILNVAKQRLGALKDSSIKFGDTRRGTNDIDVNLQEIPKRLLPALSKSASEERQHFKEVSMKSSVVFGKEEPEYHQSNMMPNWNDPATYEALNSSLRNNLKPMMPSDFFVYSLQYR